MNNIELQASKIEHNGGTVNHNENQELQDYITSLNITYEATFQPTPQPKETVLQPSRS